MKKITLTLVIVTAMLFIFCISAAAAAPVPQKPDLGVNFGAVTPIDGFVAPSDLYTATNERVLLTDGEGNYATYPTYYVTKNSTTFDFDFSKLNEAQAIQYGKSSVVMVEIPDGVTTISNSYFAGTGNFPACIYVQFPGSVTSYGSGLFGSYNSVIRAVEFLDGTEPITMGDGMFGPQHNGGTSNLQYVKFPNNLVSIGNDTFGKSWQSKTIILGENLKKVGTSFFNEATPGDKDTFVYASSNFFANPQDMFNNLFGGFDKYHSNYLRITLFYTGTQEQAQTFVDNGKAIQSGYMWDDGRALIVSASEYDYATHKPTQENGDITIVYGVNKCDAFYNGIHNEQQINSCQFGCANGCGAVEMLENPEHSYQKTVLYGDSTAVDFYKAITICNECQNCKHTTQGASIEPLFTSKGFSISLEGDGITQNFGVNLNSVQEYKENVNPSFEYGVVASANEGTPISLVEGVLTAGANTVMAKMSDTDFEFFEIKIMNLSVDYADTKVVSCAYVFDGASVYYLSEGVTGASVAGKSYSDVKAG